MPEIQYVGMIKKLHLSLGHDKPACSFSIADKKAGEVELHLAPPPDLDVNHRFHGMVQLLLAAFHNELLAEVIVSTEFHPKHAEHVGIFSKELTEDDPVSTTFIGRMATHLYIKGRDTAASAQCVISFAPPQPGQSGSWIVDGPFGHMATALIGAVASNGRIILHQKDPSAGGTPVAASATVSVWSSNLGAIK